LGCNRWYVAQFLSIFARLKPVTILYDVAMSFFAIFCALLIEQVKPLTRSNPIHHGLRHWANAVRRNFDAGKSNHGWLVWLITVALPALGVLGVHWLLVYAIGWPAAVVWNVAVLYVTLGFRQFSYHFTDIRDALDAGDEDLARQLLADWQNVDASNIPRSEIVRHVIEYSVLAAHRHVFGVLTWYVILAALGLGPFGAVFYRMAEFTVRFWKPRFKSKLSHTSSDNIHDDAPVVSDHLRATTAQAWYLVDWLPARFTAMGFAVVGNFEDAIDCWRNYAQQLPTLDNSNDGVILAATSGAMHVRLGGELLKPAARAEAANSSFDGQTNGTETEPEATVSTPGREAEPAHLRSVVGLVWRYVVLWMLLLALLTLSNLLG
jgi:adenosylcobinamide-phosphate synthase